MSGRRRWLAGLFAIAACASACSSDTSPGSDDHSPSASATIDGGDSPTAEITTPDPLEPIPADSLFGTVDNYGVIRARDGSTLVVSTGSHGRSVYRIYDRQWRPQTPPLEIQAELTIERGLANTFVGGATFTRRNGPYGPNEWVTISADGALHVVADQPTKATEPEPVRPGDVIFQTPHIGPYAYRPSTDSVVVIRRPDWNTRRHTWYTNSSGHICAHRSTARVGETAYTSVNDGRTFTELETSGIFPENAGPRLQACEPTRGRIFVMTGGEYPRWLHTLDRSTGALLSSLPLGGRFNGYEWMPLPNGKLAIGTRRRGLLVAVDNTNQTFEFRPAPRTPSASLIVVGDDLVYVSNGRTLQLSTDEGRTWKQVDLQQPG